MKALNFYNELTFMNKIVLQIAAYISLSIIIVGGYNLKQNYDLKNNIAVKRILITKDFKDPVSAQFRNEVLKQSDWLCGEINSKNSYGAYTGFKRFAAFDSRDAYLEDVGSLGTSESRFFTEPAGFSTLERIQREIDILNYRKDNNNAPPSFKSLTEEDRKRAGFEEVWNSICK